VQSPDRERVEALCSRLTASVSRRCAAA